MTILDVRARPATRGAALPVAVYSATIFLSAALLFFLEPMFSKMVLPLLGGSNTGYLQEQMRSVHPVVRVHPETGRKALFVNELWTEKILGVSPHESEHLLAMLWKHAQSPEFTMRWKWRVNDLALWDNRSFQHYAVRDYQGERVLQKGYVLGDRPRGPG